jgi:glutathione S-transferase
MILIGQYDSSFTRRVGIALSLYGIAFEHRTWSVFGDADRLMQINPLGGVPVLVLDDGTALCDSAAILDHVDRMVGPDRALMPLDPDAWAAARRVTAFATGLGERLASLFYERRLHDTASAVLTGRRERQIAATLTMLDRESAAAPGPWWCGDSMTHADVAVACTLRHLRESLPDLYDPLACPALEAHCMKAEALPVFQDISQPFIPPS